MSHLDWTDPEAVLRWLLAFHTTLADLRAVTRDMNAPPYNRELGPATHREKCEEGWKAVDSALAYAMPPSEGEPGEGEPGEPMH